MCLEHERKQLEGHMFPAQYLKFADGQGRRHFVFSKATLLNKYIITTSP